MVTATEGEFVIASIVALVHVEIIQDLVCPWCYIGQRRFDAAVEELRHTHPDLHIEVSYGPYQLDPGAPLDSARPVVEAYAAKFGGPENARAILEHVTEAARNAGLPIRMDLARRANTRLAHRLLLLAARDPHVSTALLRSLYHGYFVEGDDLGDRPTLHRMAEHAGLSVDEINSVLVGDAFETEMDIALDHTVELGINAVPTFVFADKWIVSGAQETSFFVRTLTKLTDERG
jgi:predicted DsbA family dithiol-disulfide isomerase